jgi:two-component sensor histidine kinase
MSADPLSRTVLSTGGQPLILVTEITHRVVNEYAHAISSLHRAAADAPDASSRASLKGAAARLWAYAEAHRALRAPASPGLVDLGEYLASLCAALSAASLADRGVRLTLAPEDDMVLVDSERCWHVGLLVAELLNDAVRHAFGPEGGLIRIELSGGCGLVSCRVTHNGRARPDATPGCGSGVIAGLTLALGGDIERWHGPNGAADILTFPASGDADRAAVKVKGLQ